MFLFVQVYREPDGVKISSDAVFQHLCTRADDSGNNLEVSVLSSDVAWTRTISGQTPQTLSNNSNNTTLLNSIASPERTSNDSQSK